jgi:hypothetical protein
VGAEPHHSAEDGAARRGDVIIAIVMHLLDGGA